MSCKIVNVPVASVTSFRNWLTSIAATLFNVRASARSVNVFAALAWLGFAPIASSAQEAAESLPVILVMGDSLSAEYGIKRDTGWVALTKERIEQRKFPWRVVNASVSGETTAGGVSRLPALLATHRPKLVVVELGANDALRGLSLATMRQNLITMIEASKRAGARVVVVPLRVPPNYGRAYADEFYDSFAQVSKATGAIEGQFLLDGVVQDRNNFQADAIHPNEGAQARMMENVWPTLEPMLKTRAGKSSRNSERHAEARG